MNLSKYTYTLASFAFIFSVLVLAFFTNKISSMTKSGLLKNEAAEKLYVALEEDGAVAVVDTKDNKYLGKIDLTMKNSNTSINYAAHNVQVAPDGNTVWVTANYMGTGGSGAENMQGKTEKTFPDQVIIIDPRIDAIVKRVDIGKNQHLAHVVISKNGKKAFVSAQESGVLYEIDGSKYVVDKTIYLPKGSEPHGLRISSDDNALYVALIGGKGIDVIDTNSEKSEMVPLSGSVIQSAVIPNSEYIAASIYDTKEVAFYNTVSKEVSYVQLPDKAEGPIQMYATPDGKYLYVADQGYYFEKPTSDYVYKIEVETLQVIATIQAGVAPHGVVVSQDGKKAYITNLLSGDVSVIDTTTDKEISKVKVGKMPNGISLWSHQYGGTP